LHLIFGIYDEILLEGEGIDTLTVIFIGT